VCVGITEEEEESGGCEDDDITSLVNGYRAHTAVVNGKSVIGGTALTLSQAMERCSSLTDILFGDLELLTSVCKYSCQSDEDTNEVTFCALSTHTTVFLMALCPGLLG